VVHVVPEAQTCRGFPLLLLAWEVTEIIRYSYYAVNLLNLDVAAITWLRYTLFIVLYPIGVTGELWCQIASLERIAAERIFSLAMPNAANFIFNYYVVVILIMLSYIPIFPVLYMHMFAQRKKVIGGAAIKKGN
jgi:very-long-chain (3R)-3-hydroxyacyl-CoA dehydratase